MSASASLGARSRTMAKACSDECSRVPLSMAKLAPSGVIDDADQQTSSGPNRPTSSADVSSAPVRSSARSLNEGISASAGRSQGSYEIHQEFQMITGDQTAQGRPANPNVPTNGTRIRGMLQS